MADKGEAGFNDPLGEYFDGFNIIEFMNDNDDLIESLADQSTSSKSSSSAAANNKLPQTINTSYSTDQTTSSSRNTESVEGEVWISPVPSDDYQLPQTINPLNFTSNNNTNNNVYLIDPTTSNNNNLIQTRPPPTILLPHTPNYPSTMASYSNTNNNNSASQNIQYPSPPQYNTVINQQQQHQGQFISPPLPQHLNHQQQPQHQHQQQIQQSFNRNNENNFSMGPPPIKRKATNMIAGSDLLIPSTPIIVKQEPLCDYGNNSNNNKNMLISPSISRMESCEDLQQRQIKFIPLNMEQWTTLYDINQQPLNNLQMKVIADKGFNYNSFENAFINQKKNHFQITVNINLGAPTKPAYFCVNGILKEITDFQLGLCGIKAESPTVEIGLKQSNAERKLENFVTTSINFEDKQFKIGRLHFSETTLNNARKAGKPSDQKYFQLAVKLFVYANDGTFCIVQSYQSEKVIVRATNPNHPSAFQAGNPAQFVNQNRQPDSISMTSVEGATTGWQNNKNVMYTFSPVSIGTDQQFPGAQLSVAGNIVSTGNWTRPSDRRVKEDIVNYDTRGATNRLAQVQIVGFAYTPEFADQWGLDESNRHRIGVIAQQVAEVLPDAVKENGEYLTVDENRIFMETVAAAQELYRVTGNLESKIGQVEKISVKLAKFAKNKQKFGGSTISGLTTYLEDNRSSDKKDEDGKSIYSITSSSTAPSSCNGSPSHHSRKYHHQQNYRHQQQDMCSSKFTQYTVTFLIGIMALCLLSMCSLYILDWYRRISNDPHGNLIPAFNYSDDAIGNLIEQKYELPLSWLPETQPLAPMLVSKCGLTRQCPIYCCENEMSDGGKHLRTNRSIITYPDMALIANTDKNFYELSAPLPFEHNFSLNIVNLNISIDQRFCVEHSCRPKKGRYNLYVPISPLLPTIPLKIKFTVKENKFIDNCGSLRDFFHKKCNNNFLGIEEIEHPTSYTINENTFELSVGDFIHSAYRFRIGYTTESCNMSEDQRGRSFDEFNIVFYRKCFA